MADRSPDRLQLLRGVTSGRASARGPQSLPHPLGHGQPLPSRNTLDIPELGIVQQDLKSLTHAMSMIG